MRNTLTMPRFLLPGTFSMAGSLTPDGTRAKNILTIPGIARNFRALPGGGDGQGFSEVADVITQTIDGVDTRVLFDVYRQAVVLRNAQRQPILDFLTYKVQGPVEGIPVSNGTARFERSSEYGVPRSARPGVALNWMGFDFDWFDLSTRFTWEFLSEATASQVDAIAQNALEADNILVWSMVMWTLFNNATRNTTINTPGGSKPYNVYTFYNGDTEVPPTWKTNTFTAPHNHYLVSGAATIDAGDLDQIWTELSHHGYQKSEGYDLITMMNTAQVDVVRQFRSIANGGTAKYDFIPAANTPSFLLPVTLRVADGQVQVPDTLKGMKVAGTYGEFVIVQEDQIPPGYVVAFATGGPESVQNPIGIREHANPALRGLRIVKGRNDDYPLQEAIYQRGMGTGIRHRGAGVVMQITTNPTYAIPTAYNTQP